MKTKSIEEKLAFPIEKTNKMEPKQISNRNRIVATSVVVFLLLCCGFWYFGIARNGQKVNHENRYVDSPAVSKDTAIHSKPVAKSNINELPNKKHSNEIIYPTGFFSGTKTFCDGFDAWRIEVYISGNNISIKIFPDPKNPNFDSPSEAVETVNGKIENGKIVTNDPPEYLTNRYRYENSVLYEKNNEGGENEYRECK